MYEPLNWTYHNEQKSSGEAGQENNSNDSSINISIENVVWWRTANNFSLHRSAAHSTFGSMNWTISLMIIRHDNNTMWSKPLFEPPWAESCGAHAESKCE